MDSSLPWRSSKRGKRSAHPANAFQSLVEAASILTPSQWSYADWVTNGLDSEGVALAKRALDSGSGFLILKGFPLGDSEEKSTADFEALVRVFGRVTVHGASKKRIWRVSPRASLAHVPTFSETASEAPLHTDNSWVPEPEKYFSLLVLNPATEGGDSVLLPVDELKRGFALTEAGPQAIHLLTTNQFPFAMPVVFRNPQDFVEVVTSSVFDSPLGFRFRYDVIKAGFAARPDLSNPEKVWAVEAFNDYLLGVLEMSRGLRLERGDVVLANNHRVLHARTDFSDPNRLLLRARMAGEPCDD